MPALPRALARRLDRLASQAHRFHRFAHHPLCDEYSAEVLRPSRRLYLCKGCTLAGLGIGAGAIVALALPLEAGAVLGFVCAGTMGVAFRSRRRSKWLTRFAPTLGLTATFFLGLRHGGAPGFLATGLALVAMGSALVLYRRRRPDRTPCLACPERDLPVPCRGYAAIVRRERAFQRLACRLIDASGPRP
jgi:hypothetical protein